MTMHKLKIINHFLERLIRGVKTCEIRKNDRDYQVGDTLAFVDKRLNQDVYFEITHVHSGIGMADGYVCLSLKRMWGEK